MNKFETKSKKISFDMKGDEINPIITMEIPSDIFEKLFQCHRFRLNGGTGMILELNIVSPFIIECVIYGYHRYMKCRSSIDKILTDYKDIILTWDD